jgi:hypothetical protein
MPRKDTGPQHPTGRPRCTSPRPRRCTGFAGERTLRTRRSHTVRPCKASADSTCRSGCTSRLQRPGTGLLQGSRRLGMRRPRTPGSCNSRSACTATRCHRADTRSAPHRTRPEPTRRPAPCRSSRGGRGTGSDRGRCSRRHLGLPRRSWRRTRTPGVRPRPRRWQRRRTHPSERRMSRGRSLPGCLAAAAQRTGCPSRTKSAWSRQRAHPGGPHRCHAVLRLRRRGPR